MIKLKICLPVILMVLSMLSYADEEQSPTFEMPFVVYHTVDLPAEVVWSYFWGKKKELWTVPWATLAGEEGKVGEVFGEAAMLEEQGGLSEAKQRYYNVNEVIRVEPYKNFVLKMYLQKPGKESERRFSGYDVVTLSEQKGTTTVVFHQLNIAYKDVYNTAELQKLIDPKAADPYAKVKDLGEASSIVFGLD